jgi:hypothetical protein
MIHLPTPKPVTDRDRTRGSAVATLHTWRVIAIAAVVLFATSGTVFLLVADGARMWNGGLTCLVIAAAAGVCVVLTYLLEALLPYPQRGGGVEPDATAEDVCRDLRRRRNWP